MKKCHKIFYFQELYDAKSLAEETDLRLKQDLAERRRALHEQAERARIRGNKALETEILKHVSLLSCVYNHVNGK